MNKPLVVTYAEAGKILMGISARSVRRMVDKGDLPYVKVRGRVGIPYDALLVYVNSRTQFAHEDQEKQCLTAERIAHSGGSRTPTAQADKLAEVVKLLTSKKQKR